MAKPTKAMLATIATIAAAPNGILMMTQDEGKALVDAGLAVVDTANVEGDKAAVSLTDAGKTHAPEVAASTGASKFEIYDGIEIPATTRRGRESGYPFDKLEVGQSFHVPVTEKNADPAARLAVAHCFVAGRLVVAVALAAASSGGGVLAPELALFCSISGRISTVNPIFFRLDKYRSA